MKKFNLFTIHDAVVNTQRFPLIRYYTVASIITITLTAFAVNHIFTKIEMYKILELTEIKALHEADHLYTILTTEYGMNSNAENMVSMDVFADKKFMEKKLKHPNLPDNIAFFSIIKPDRYVIFSTIGEFQDTYHKIHPGFASTALGNYSTDLIEMPMEDGSIATLFEIYNPIYENNSQKTNSIGLLKTYHYLEDAGSVFILGDTYSRILATTLTMGTMFLILLIIVIYGQKAINRSYLYLEDTVAERTKKLSAANAQLHAEINERKQTEKKLNRARERAEKSDQVKTLFMANMSHEIRTPLNNILGYTEVLEEDLKTLVNEEQKSMFPVIRDNGKRLMKTVHEVLDISQIEAGTFKIVKSKISLLHILEELVEDYLPRAKEKGLKIVPDFTIKKAQVYADEYSLKQALSNILDNAVKFTEKGEIKIELNEVDGKYCLIIKDSGIGISKKYFKNIFEPYTQESEGFTKNYQGIGLGLALAKRYLELNGIQLNIKSKPLEGTAVIIKF